MDNMDNKVFYNQNEISKTLKELNDRYFKVTNYIKISSILIGFILLLCVVFIKMASGICFWIGLLGGFLVCFPVMFELFETNELKCKYLDYKIKNKLLN